MKFVYKSKTEAQKYFMSQKVRTFDYNECEKIVKKFIPAIKNKFGNLTILDCNKIYEEDDRLRSRNSTPRQTLVTTYIPCASFFYINFLLKNNDTNVVDLGCGMNFFKDIIPNIVGIDPVDERADIKDMFDEDFVANHKSSYKAVFSIDALHFIPISKFADRVRQFYSLLQNGGRGYLSLNAQRMLEQEKEKYLIFPTSDVQPFEVQEYIENQIHEQLYDINFLVKDVLITEKADEFIDGNIRLVMEK